jgi:hypothetical protein
MTATAEPGQHSALGRAKQAIPLLLVLLGVGLAAAGVYTAARGIDAKGQVETELRAQHITTPADASIPNSPVTDLATARSMADVIGKHAEETGQGRTYAEMGRFVAASGGDTDEASEAVKGADGKPVPNPIRNTLFQASALRTGLYSSVMAFEIANLVAGLGVLLIVLGLGFAATGAALTQRSTPATGQRAPTAEVDDRSRLNVEPATVA